MDGMLSGRVQHLQPVGHSTLLQFRITSTNATAMASLLVAHLLDFMRPQRYHRYTVCRDVSRICI